MESSTQRPPEPRVRPPPRLYVTLLGGFGLSAEPTDRRPAPVWRLRKAKSLVKLLALTPGHAVHRDVLAEALWPRSSPGAAANNLHQALHAARRALDQVGVDGHQALRLAEEVVVLDPDGGLQVDVEEADAAARRARHTGRPEEARRALELHTPELLPEDRFEDWVGPRREELQARRLGLLVDLAGRTEADDPTGAVALLRAALDLDPLHEPACRLLMQVCARAGRHPEALAAYERLRLGLERATGAEPDPQTRGMYRQLLAGSVAGPTAGPGTGRHNLPLQATTFVGRRRELADTGHLLRETRLLTLTGPGGCGKTRLALELASGLVDGPRHGVWLVELAGLRDPDLLPQAVASAVGLVLPADAESLPALVGLLASRQLVLLLDTCEHLVDACASLAGALLRRCPRVSVLATSREPLRVPGEVTWRVPSLGVPATDPAPALEVLVQYESVQLFAARARTARPDFRLDAAAAPTVAVVCARLDGIPLALELAAARVAHLPVEQIAARLDDALLLLGGGSSGEALTRQQTLAATLEWSHELLTADERVLLRRLAVFAGSPGLDAVEEVCGDPGGFDVLAVLSRLVDKSLVLAERSGSTWRYRLLDTVRQFAARRLAEAGEAEELERRHRVWYGRLAAELDLERSGPVVTSPSPRLDLAYDDLRAALRSAVEQDPPAALHLAVSLWRFWLARGHLGEGARWLDAALAAAPGRTPLHAAAWFAHAALDVRRGDGSRLERYARDGVQVARERAEPADLAQALHLQSLFAWLRGEWDEADRIAGEASHTAARAGATGVVACAAHVRGLVGLSRGDDEAAEACLGEALRVVERLADEPCPYFSAATLGFAVEDVPRGRPLVFFEETVLLARRVGSAQAAGYLLANLAAAARLRGDLDDAGRLLRRAEARFDAVRDPEGRALALNLLGAVERSAGRTAPGRRLLLEGLRLRRSVGDRRGTAVSQGNLGVLLAAAGQAERGRVLLQRAAAAFEAMQDRPGAAGTVLNLGSVALAAGREEEARRLLGRARALLDVPGAHRARAWTSATLADLVPGPESRALRDAARAEFDRLGERRGLASVRACPTGRTTLPFQEGPGR